MTDNIIPRIRDILASHRMTSAESFALTRLVVDASEKTTTTADRERIAELERDLAASRVAYANLDGEFAAVLGKHAATTAQLRANLAECRSVNCTLQSMVNEAAKHTGDLPTAATEVAPLLATAVVEEQGPWVAHYVDGSNNNLWCGVHGWRLHLDYTEAFASYAGCVAYLAQHGDVEDGERVITLAEARAIAGAK